MVKLKKPRGLLTEYWQEARSPGSHRRLQGIEPRTRINIFERVDLGRQPAPESTWPAGYATYRDCAYKGRAAEIALGHLIVFTTDGFGIDQVDSAISVNNLCYIFALLLARLGRIIVVRFDFVPMRPVAINLGGGPTI